MSNDESFSSDAPDSVPDGDDAGEAGVASGGSETPADAVTDSAGAVSDSAPGTHADVEWLTRDVMLHEPVLIVMMTGWIDAAGAAAQAIDAVAEECEASPLLRFDDDTYIDYRARRPTMELREGVNTNLVWNTIELSAGRSPNGRDVLLLTGPEPDMRWKQFAGRVADLAVELGVIQMVAFGAYPFAAPHTRTPRLSCSSPSTDVLASVDFARSSVDVPAGMAAVLEHAVHARRIPALGIWAQVPHYVSAMSYPASAVALLDGLERATGLRIVGTELRREVGIQRQRIDRMVEDNDEHRTMIQQLESLHDAALEDERDATGEMQFRSGDEIAAEIQEFLRDQQD